MIKDNLYIKTSTSVNYSISQIFNGSLIDNLQKDEGMLEIQGLLYKYNIYPSGVDWDINLALELAYGYLKKFYRCEYIYKNEIANQILFKYHESENATLLKEFSCGSAIADIVIINGHITVYEIKTELDNFDRLESQLNSYKLYSDYVYVVTYPEAYNKVKQLISEDVGIIILDKKNLIKKKRRAKLQKYFNKHSVVTSLRQLELIFAYESLNKSFPKMGTGQILRYCYDWFSSLDDKLAYKIYKRALHSRKPKEIQIELINNCTPSLKMVFLSKDLSKKNCIEIKKMLF